jgi:hypothetical protein
MLNVLNLTLKPMTEPISPAAQAVLDALYLEELNGPQQLMARAHAAAALRAAADQVVPRPIRLSRDSYAEGAYDQRLNDRQQLLAIAAELEGGNV